MESDLINKLKRINEQIKNTGYNYELYQIRGDINFNLKKYNEAFFDYLVAICCCGYNRRTIKPFDDTINSFIKKEKEIKELYYRANEKIKINDFDNAVDIYKRIYKIDQNESSALIKMIEIYIDLKKYYLAIEYCNKIINLNNYDFNTFLAYSYRANAYENKKNTKKAIEDLTYLPSFGKKILEKYLDITDKNNQYQKLLIKNLEENRVFSSKAINENSNIIINKCILRYEPENIQSLFSLSSSYEKIGKYTNANEIYKKIINIKNNTIENIGNAYLNLAYNKEIKGNYQSSLKYYNIVIDLNVADKLSNEIICSYYSDIPDEVGLYKRRAYVKSKLNDPTEVEDYNKIIDIYDKILEKSETPIMYFHRGNIYQYCLKNYEEAISDYVVGLILISLSEDEDDPIKISIYEYLANAYLKNNQYEFAINNCNKIIEEHPKQANEKVYKISAVAKEKLENYKGALNDYKKAFNIIEKKISDRENYTKKYESQSSYKILTYADEYREKNIYKEEYEEQKLLELKIKEIEKIIISLY